LGQTLHPPLRLQCSRARAHLLLEDQLKRPLAAQAFGALGRAGPMLVQTPRHIGGDTGVELARPETDEVEKPVIHSEASTGTTWAINGGSIRRRGRWRPHPAPARRRYPGHPSFRQPAARRRRSWIAPTPAGLRNGW